MHAYPVFSPKPSETWVSKVAWPLLQIAVVTPKYKDLMPDPVLHRASVCSVGILRSCGNVKSFNREGRPS
jgi:hypothetical protein